MRKPILSTVLLTTALLIAQMAMTVSAEETDETVIPTDPGSQTEQTENSTQLLQNSRYEQYAGMYSYDGVAGQLNSIGILLGSGESFDLENLPDRQQACTMIVRMLGEAEAAVAAYAAGEITCPFTDVDTWAMPYVAWLYEKGIVKGIGDGNFGNTECTAQMYMTFMLRALGYTVAWSADSDGGFDLLYADVLDFGREINLWDDLLACEPQFTRGVMSAVTYQTLAAKVKDTDDRLLSVLTSAGAIDAACAQPILSLYDRVDAAVEMEKAAVPTAADGIRLTGDMTQDEYYEYAVIGAPEGDLTENAYSSMAFEIGLDFTQEKPQLALTGQIYAQLPDAELTLPMGMWMRDDTAYVDFLDEKAMVDMTDEAAMAVLPIGFGDLSAVISEANSQYYTVGDVNMQLLDGSDESGLVGIVITYDTSDFMWPIIASMLNAEGFSENAILRAVVTTEKFIDGGGTLSGVYSGMYANLTEEYPQTAVMQSASVLIESMVSYTAWGDAVTLTFPDFSQFQASPAVTQ